ncbi:STAS domain-containing protein [Umezawaea tangerina]|uniref:Anti-sigma factor antagonist n=1 Tax=Umezawaea tangerina TaxID=84725 RepID=A0A2T0SK01_9PSEU|nr:STAS domain-containing protein [Umezawaea tangerina]PRY33740.1 stage II sporulation protein AA (anti-sigma F factor antagonist) [Umezawaea tangerina]
MPDPTATGATAPQPAVLASVQVNRAKQDLVVLHVSGELDTTSAQELSVPLQTHLTEGVRTVVVDLGGVRFLGSAGLEALVIGHQRATELGSDFIVVASSRAALRPIEATGLNAVFTILGSVDEAVEQHDKAAGA